MKHTSMHGTKKESKEVTSNQVTMEEIKKKKKQAHKKPRKRIFKHAWNQGNKQTSTHET
jgi:hypothetical protein